MVRNINCMLTARRSTVTWLSTLHRPSNPIKKALICRSANQNTIIIVTCFIHSFNHSFIHSLRTVRAELRMQLMQLVVFMLCYNLCYTAMLYHVNFVQLLLNSSRARTGNGQEYFCAGLSQVHMTWKNV